MGLWTPSGRSVAGHSVRWDDPLSKNLEIVIVNRKVETGVGTVWHELVGGDIDYEADSGGTAVVTPHGVGSRGSSGAYPFSSVSARIRNIGLDTEPITVCFVGGYDELTSGNYYDFFITNTTNTTLSMGPWNLQPRMRFYTGGSGQNNYISAHTIPAYEGFVNTAYVDGVAPYYRYNEWASGAVSKTNIGYDQLRIGYSGTNSHGALVTMYLWRGIMPTRWHDLLYQDPHRLTRPRTWSIPFASTHQTAGPAGAGHPYSQRLATTKYQRMNHKFVAGAY